MSPQHYYAGIGSRSTPHEVQLEMAALASELSRRGWVLRSGGAYGADTAFEDPVPSDLKEIFIPWDNYNQRRENNGSCKSIENNLKYLTDAYKTAERFHPAWHYCDPAARQLHARNVFIMLGKKLDKPVKAVICWTPDGLDSGGTGLGIRLAKNYEIPIYNLKKQRPRSIIAGFERIQQFQKLQLVPNDRAPGE